VPADMRDLARDLTAETSDLRTLVTGLDEPGWRRLTPAEGWTIADQFTHLAFFDDAAIASATDPTGFAHMQQNVITGGLTPDTVADQYRSVPFKFRRPATKTGLKLRTAAGGSGQRRRIG
jgi:Mycothiol maleylpyruvate isomerase N-terminal domain